MNHIEVDYAVLIFGLIGIAVGLQKWYKLYTLRKRGVKTGGTVVKMIINENEDGNTYSPVVEYYTPDMLRFVNQVEIGLSQYSRYAIGDKVEVLYYRDNPGSFIINDRNFIVAVIVFLFVGAFLVGCGIWGILAF